MFFPRLRRRAKWIFLVLALVFALGFIGFGVGAGGSGIGNFISDFIHGNTGSSGTSVADARAKVAKNPRDATAQMELATALTTTGDLTGAITALDAYLKLRPKDTDALQQQAGLWARVAERKRQVAINAFQSAQTADPAQTFDNGTFSQAIGQDPLTTQLTQQATQRENSAIIALQNAYRQEENVYKKLAGLLPRDPATQLQLGQAAQLAQDTTTAIGAYKTFLKLAPDDPSAPQVRKVLKSLQTAPTTTPSG